MRLPSSKSEPLLRELGPVQVVVSVPNVWKTSHKSPARSHWTTESLKQQVFTDPVSKARAILERSRRTTKANSPFIPVAKLPPLAPDPRPAIACKPPTCYSAKSHRRWDKILERWDSIPTLRKELLDEDYATIQKEFPHQSPPLHVGPESDQVKLSVDSTRRLHQRAEVDLKSKGYPSIKCTCCDRAVSPVKRVLFEVVARPVDEVLCKSCGYSAIRREQDGLIRNLEQSQPGSSTMSFIVENAAESNITVVGALINNL